MITIKFNQLQDYKNALKKEWYITNGKGGFASSSILLCNTRRYHGLLNISDSPPYNKLHTLSCVQEDIIVEEEVFKTGIYQFREVYNLEGLNILERFEFDIFPRFIYRFKNIYLIKEIFMTPLKNETIIHYHVLNPDSRKISFYIKPYFSFRNIHSLGNIDLKPLEEPKINKNILKLEVNFLSHPIKIISTKGRWHREIIDIKNLFFFQE